MKASKKVMESVIVSGLALTLAVTAVTGNGVNCSKGCSRHTVCQ